MKVLHILFVANTTSLFGANRSMLDLAVRLKELGQNISFFIPKEENARRRYLLRKELSKYGFRYSFENYFPSVHHKQEKGISMRLLRAEANRLCLKKMEDKAERWGIDIIHTNSLTHTVGAQLGRRIKKPHVWHIRETLESDYAMLYDNKLFYRYTLSRAKQIICISDYVKEIHSEVLPSKAPVIVLHDGFNIENYILENAYQKEPQVFRIIICGIIREEKRQLDAVKAMNILIHRYCMKNIYLEIIGDSTEEYIHRIRKYIVANDLERYIKILPFQDDLREIRRHADIALMCSMNEALGRVTIESMLSENIVIGANSAGTVELIEDEITGYLYEAGNIEDLSEKIRCVIANWNKQEDVIKRAKEYARSNFDISVYTRKILDIYEAVIED